MSDTLTDDPIDGIDLTNLDGWTHCNDSSRMRKTDNGQGLGRDSRDQYSNSWVRFDND